MIVGRIVAVACAEADDIVLIPCPVAGVVEGKEELEACLAGYVEGQLQGPGDAIHVVGDVERKGVYVCFLGKAYVRLPV